MNVDYVIQSVIFKQPKYTPAEAKKWLKEHHYSGRKLDRTANMLRFRQMTPEKVEQYGFTEYRTKELGRSGISLVIAYKKSIEGGSLSNTFRNIWNRIRRRHQAVVVPIAEVAPPPPVLPYNTPFAPNDAELAEATEIPITMAEVAPDDIEEYYTPIVKKERADLEKKYKKANTAYNVARSELIQARVVYGDVSWQSIEAENNVDRRYNERQEIIEQLRDLRTREAYLPFRNRPQFDTLRWDFYRDVAFSRDYMNSQLERRLPVRDRPIRQAEVLTLGGIEGEDQSLPAKEPQYDISTFGDREEERLAEAERVYNETMEEEIEKQGMSGEDKPSGSGIYMKGFGRIGRGEGLSSSKIAPTPVPRPSIDAETQAILDDIARLEAQNREIGERNALRTQQNILRQKTNNDLLKKFKDVSDASVYQETRRLSAMEELFDPQGKKKRLLKKQQDEAKARAKANTGSIAVDNYMKAVEDKKKGGDKPSGSGIYMKGFGRIMGGRIKRKAESAFDEEDEEIDPSLIRDEEDEEDDEEDDEQFYYDNDDEEEEEEEEEEEDDVAEYNSYVDLVLQDMMEMEGYLWQDLNRIDAGILQVPNKEASINTLFQKIDNIDRIIRELQTILENNQDIEIAKLVKDYTDEYIETDKPYVDISEWRGGVLA